eukprot:jgi/Mesvir1/21885/Mv01954-RA.1
MAGDDPAEKSRTRRLLPASVRGILSRKKKKEVVVETKITETHPGSDGRMGLSIQGVGRAIPLAPAPEPLPFAAALKPSSARNEAPSKASGARVLAGQQAQGATPTSPLAIAGSSVAVAGSSTGVVVPKRPSGMIARQIQRFREAPPLPAEERALQETEGPNQWWSSAQAVSGRGPGPADMGGHAGMVQGPPAAAASATASAAMAARTPAAGKEEQGAAHGRLQSLQAERDRLRQLLGLDADEPTQAGAHAVVDRSAVVEDGLPGSPGDLRGQLLFKGGLRALGPAGQPRPRYRNSPGTDAETEDHDASGDLSGEVAGDVDADAGEDGGGGDGGGDGDGDVTPRHGGGSQEGGAPSDSGAQPPPSMLRKALLDLARASPLVHKALRNIETDEQGRVSAEYLHRVQQALQPAAGRPSHVADGSDSEDEVHGDASGHRAQGDGDESDIGDYDLGRPQGDARGIAARARGFSAKGVRDRGPFPSVAPSAAGAAPTPPVYAIDASRVLAAVQGVARERHQKEEEAVRRIAATAPRPRQEGLFPLGESAAQGGDAAGGVPEGGFWGWGEDSRRAEGGGDEGVDDDDQAHVPVGHYEASRHAPAAPTSPHDERGTSGQGLVAGASGQPPSLLSVRRLEQLREQRAAARRRDAGAGDGGQQPGSNTTRDPSAEMPVPVQVSHAGQAAMAAAVASRGSDRQAPGVGRSTAPVPAASAGGVAPGVPSAALLAREFGFGVARSAGALEPDDDYLAELERLSAASSNSLRGSASGRHAGQEGALSPHGVEAMAPRSVSHDDVARRDAAARVLQARVRGHLVRTRAGEGKQGSRQGGPHARAPLSPVLEERAPHLEAAAAESGGVPAMQPRNEDAEALVASAVAFLTRVDTWLSSQRVRPLELFRQWDRDSSGRLSVAELYQLMKHVAPDVTPLQLRFFQLMVDVDGDGKVSYKEFLKAVKEGKAAWMRAGADYWRPRPGSTPKGAQARGSEESSSSTSPLQVLALHFRGRPSGIRPIFYSVDSAGRGYLDHRQLAVLFRRAVPTLSSLDVRTALAMAMTMPQLLQRKAGGGQGDTTAGSGEEVGEVMLADRITLRQLEEMFLGARELRASREASSKRAGVALAEVGPGLVDDTAAASLHKGDSASEISAEASAHDARAQSVIDDTHVRAAVQRVESSTHVVAAQGSLGHQSDQGNRGERHHGRNDAVAGAAVMAVAADVGITPTDGGAAAARLAKGLLQEFSAEKGTGRGIWGELVDDMEDEDKLTPGEVAVSHPWKSRAAPGDGNSSGNRRTRERSDGQGLPGGQTRHVEADIGEVGEEEARERKAEQQREREQQQRELDKREQQQRERDEREQQQRERDEREQQQRERDEREQQKQEREKREREEWERQMEHERERERERGRQEAEARYRERERAWAQERDAEREKEKERDRVREVEEREKEAKRQAQLERALESLRKSHRDREVELQRRHEAEVGREKARVAALEGERDALLAREREAKWEQEEDRARARTHEGELERAREQVAAEAQRLRLRLDAAEEALDACRGEREALRAQVEAARADQRGAEERAWDAQGRVDALEAALEQERVLRLQVAKGRDKAEEEAREQARELLSARHLAGDEEARCAALQEQVESLLARLVLADTRAKDQGERERELQEGLVRAQAEARRAKEEAASLRPLLDQEQASRRRDTEEHKAAVKQLQERITELQRTLNAKGERERMLPPATSTMATVTDKDMAAEEQARMLAEARQEVASLHASRDRWQQESAAKEAALRDQLASVTASLREAEAERKRMAAQLQEAARSAPLAPAHRDRYKRDVPAAVTPPLARGGAPEYHATGSAADGTQYEHPSSSLRGQAITGAVGGGREDATIASSDDPEAKDNDWRAPEGVRRPTMDRLAGVTASKVGVGSSPDTAGHPSLPLSPGAASEGVAAASNRAGIGQVEQGTDACDTCQVAAIAGLSSPRDLRGLHASETALHQSRPMAQPAGALADISNMLETASTAVSRHAVSGAGGSTGTVWREKGMHASHSKGLSEESSGKEQISGAATQRYAKEFKDPGGRDNASYYDGNAGSRSQFSAGPATPYAASTSASHPSPSHARFDVASDDEDAWRASQFSDSWHQQPKHGRQAPDLAADLRLSEVVSAIHSELDDAVARVARHPTQHRTPAPWQARQPPPLHGRDDSAPARSHPPDRGHPLTPGTGSYFGGGPHAQAAPSSAGTEAMLGLSTGRVVPSVVPGVPVTGFLDAPMRAQVVTGGRSAAPHQVSASDAPSRICPPSASAGQPAAANVQGPQGSRGVTGSTGTPSARRSAVSNGGPPRGGEGGRNRDDAAPYVGHLTRDSSVATQATARQWAVSEREQHGGPMESGEVWADHGPPSKYRPQGGRPNAGTETVVEPTVPMWQNWMVPPGGGGPGTAPSQAMDMPTAMPYTAHPSAAQSRATGPSGRHAGGSEPPLAAGQATRVARDGVPARGPPWGQAVPPQPMAPAAPSVAWSTPVPMNVWAPEPRAWGQEHRGYVALSEVRQGEDALAYAYATFSGGWVSAPVATVPPSSVAGVEPQMVGVTDQRPRMENVVPNDAATWRGQGSVEGMYGFAAERGDGWQYGLASLPRDGGVKQRGYSGGTARLPDAHIAETWRQALAVYVRE